VLSILTTKEKVLVSATDIIQVFYISSRWINAKIASTWFVGKYFGGTEMGEIGSGSSPTTARAVSILSLQFATHSLS
jgi:hypothetical protein